MRAREFRPLFGLRMDHFGYELSAMRLANEIFLCLAP